MLATTWWNVVLHWMGLTNASGKLYLLWSGVFADLTIFGAAAVLYRKLNCHAKGCWRLGIHHVDGTPFVTCRTHHPTIDAKPTHHDIRRAHQAAKGSAVAPIVVKSSAEVLDALTVVQQPKKAPRKRAPAKKTAKRTSR